MDFVETEGDTIDAAIDNALKLLGVEREKLPSICLGRTQGHSGIRRAEGQDSRCAEKNRLEIDCRQIPPQLRSAKPTAPAPMVETASGAEPAAISSTSPPGRQGQDDFGGYPRSHGCQQRQWNKKRRRSGEEIILEIHADNSGLLIGRKGQTLEALQYLVTRIAGERQSSEGPHIVIDIENYRERRRRSLEDMALRLGEKAKRQRKTVTVDALSAADRRIIHAALQDDPWVIDQEVSARDPIAAC